MAVCIAADPRAQPAFGCRSTSAMVSKHHIRPCGWACRLVLALVGLVRELLLLALLSYAATGSLYEAYWLAG